MTTTSARLLQIITTSITVRERWSESNFQVARDHDVGLPLIGRASVTVSINVYAMQYNLHHVDRGGQLCFLPTRPCCVQLYEQCLHFSLIVLRCWSWRSIRDVQSRGKTYCIEKNARQTEAQCNGCPEPAATRRNISPYSCDDSRGQKVRRT